MRIILKVLFSKFHDRVEKSGRYIGLLVLVIMGLVTSEVIARYLFNSPTTWNWNITSHLLGVYVLFAGVYAMSQSAHIRIDMIYNLFSKRIRLIARIIGLLCFLFFTISLIWKGGEIGYASFTYREKLMGMFEMPLYPLKLVIPIIGVIFLLEGIAIFLKEEGLLEEKPKE
jgi:TRAP-type mannitol/chloroaromatic compound transport system permease small subunit